MLFLIPRHGIIYAGTTDTPYTGDKDHPPVTREDVQYILRGIEYIFPSLTLAEEDVLSSWAGIRPLIYEEGKSASEISRKDEIFISPHGLISMAGGKLTGYRKMAEKVVNRIVRKGGWHDKKRCFTKEIPLTENPFPGLEEVQVFEKEMLEKYGMFGEEEIGEMVMKYGRTAEELLAQAAENGGSLLLAEAEHAIAQEMAIRPLDFLERRSGRLLFSIQQVRKEMDQVAVLFAERFGWDEGTLRKEKEALEQRIREITPPFQPEE
jgi:glycerol-3-phosphate dehydrogenase